MDVKTRVLNQQTVLIQLNEDDIIDMLIRNGKLENNFKSASVQFHVPGGGDWSNMAIDIDDKDPICVVAIYQQEKEL